jgi:hypothetical protein
MIGQESPMTQKSPHDPNLDRWVNEQLEQIERQSVRSKILVYVGLLTLMAGLGVVTYLAYSDTPDGGAGDTAPLTGEELEAVSG